MLRRFIAAIALGLAAYFFFGCAGPAQTMINRENIPAFAQTKILSVTLMNGDLKAFDEAGGWYHERYKNKTRVIIGRSLQGERLEIALVDVRKARLENSEVEMDARGIFPAFIIVGVLVAIL
jgi:hypothetical protein